MSSESQLANTDFLLDQALHMLPASSVDRRLWCYGQFAQTGQGVRRLKTHPHSPETFGSIRSVFASLMPDLDISQQKRVSAYLHELNRVAPWGSDLPTMDIERHV